MRDGGVVPSSKRVCRDAAIQGGIVVKCYIYAADVYCVKCGRDIRQRLTEQGLRPDNPHDETAYDSDEYPKGPDNVDESDSPQHCGSGDDCLDALELNGVKYGKFLENPLTSEGIEYVKESHVERPTDLTEMWMEFYGLETETEDDDDD